MYARRRQWCTRLRTAHEQSQKPTKAVCDSETVRQARTFVMAFQTAGHVLLLGCAQLSAPGRPADDATADSSCSTHIKTSQQIAHNPITSIVVAIVRLCTTLCGETFAAEEVHSIHRRTADVTPDGGPGVSWDMYVYVCSPVPVQQVPAAHCAPTSWQQPGLEGCLHQPAHRDTHSSTCHTPMHANNH